MAELSLANKPFNSLQQTAHQLASCTDQLFQQLEQQQALASITDRIRSSLDLETIFKTTAAEIRQLLNADRVGIFRFTPETGWDEGEFVAEDVAPGVVSALAAKVYDHCFGPQFAAYYTQGRIQAVADIYAAELSNCHIQILEQFQVRANLIVPVLKGEDLWGLLCVHQCNNARRWQLTEIEFVRKIADHFAIALQQADYLSQIQEKAALLVQAQAQEKALSRQKALVKITNRIRQSLDWEAICQSATVEVRQLLEVDRVTVYRFNDDWSGDFLFESITEGWQPLVGVSSCIEDTHLMETQGGRYAANETFAIPDIYKAGHTDCHVDLLEQFQARAYAIAPIFQGDRLWGLLAAFQNSGPRQWQADEVELLAQIGGQLGIVLQQATEQAHKLNRQKALVKITNRIRQSLDWQVVCQTATDEVRQLLDADRVAIYQFNEDWSGDFRVESIAKGWEPLVGVSPSIEDTHLMETQGGRYANNETLAIPDIYEAGHTDCHVALLEQFQARAYAIAPIFQGDRLWGLLAAFQNSGPRHWQADEVELLTQIGEQLGIALQQAESVQKIQAQSAELKQLLTERQQSQAQLIQNEKMASLGQLVAGVAHEINNPVNFIYGNLSHVNRYVDNVLSLINGYQTQDLNSGDNLSALQAQAEEIDLDFVMEDLPKTLDSMRIGTERIRHIVLSLRNFSRLDEAERKAVDIHAGLDSTLLILGHRLKACGEHPEIQVVKTYGKLPPVECYPAQLNQVFMNLLANAVDAVDQKIADQDLDRQQSDTDYTPTIYLTTQLDKSGQVEIRIRDNGAGIKKKHTNKVFDHFFTTKVSGKGTGLGLAIAKQIVTERHGGTLVLQSTSGQGAEFIIGLSTKLAQ